MSRSPSKQSRRALLEVEVLEGRELPSALFGHSPGGHPLGAHPLGEHRSVSQAPWTPPVPVAEATAKFTIKGTSIQYDSLGLPDFLTGNIYLATKPNGSPVGHYQEILTPIFANGQFVGTNGVATFTFFVGSNPNLVFETITTQEVSLIRGVNPNTGALLVHSSGTITSASGIFNHIEGGFSSSSEVTLGAKFSDTTAVQFTVHAAPGFGTVLV